MKTEIRTILMVGALAAVLALPLIAQSVEVQSNAVGAATDAPIVTEVEPDTEFLTTLACTLNRPSEVQRYGVVCTGASRLDVRVADCCLAGDHWEVKSKSWDVRPNSGVTTSPGAMNAFGVRSRIYNYGGTSQRPGLLNAEVDCTYLHGTGAFPGSAFLRLSSDGKCTVTDLGKGDEIYRTP